jgi:hypothetical protein
MNALLDQPLEKSKAIGLAGNAVHDDCVSTPEARPGRCAGNGSIPRFDGVCAGLNRGLESVVSTTIAWIVLAFSLTFTALMVVGIAVVLTCGLACYA